MLPRTSELLKKCDVMGPRYTSYPTSDHIGTLFELDQLYAKVAKEHGITHYYRARSFNGEPESSQVLRSLLKEAAA